MPTPTDSGCIQPIPRHLEDIRSLALLEERCAKLRARIRAHDAGAVMAVGIAEAAHRITSTPAPAPSPASDYTCCLSSRNQL